MPSRRTYDHRIRAAIMASGDANLFPELNIPRSTTDTWLRRGADDVVGVDDDCTVLLVRVKRLERQLRVLVHGVDLSKLREALNTRKYRARIEADVQAALEAGITQSPSLVVSDLLVPGSNPKWKYEYALHLVRKRP